MNILAPIYPSSQTFALIILVGIRLVPLLSYSLPEFKKENKGRRKRVNKEYSFLKDGKQTKATHGFRNTDRNYPEIIIRSR